MNFPEIKHYEHCQACKERVRQMLVALHGDCHPSRQFPWPAKPEDYVSAAVGDTLQRIRAALGELRGHRGFIKSALVPPCDYYLPQRKQIVEFDEDQHFSRPRLATLLLYPAQLEYGFALDHWKDLCRRIAAVDDTPIDRDERRAWYDVLRDLVPTIHGFAPTVRLYAGDHVWCSLDPANSKDRESFLRFFNKPTQS
jgi:hypothetical protein